MDLEQLLLQLAGLTERAQAIWEAELRADEDNLYGENDEIEATLWFTLERNGRGEWCCGWRVQQDESTTWAIQASGKTPLEAAQVVLIAIEEPVPGTPSEEC